MVMVFGSALFVCVYVCVCVCVCVCQWLYAQEYVYFMQTDECMGYSHVDLPVPCHYAG